MVRINNNRECTHAFFYADCNTNYTFGTQCSFDFNDWYDKNIVSNFYSYYTKVAMIYYSEKTSQNYLLIHWSSMTPTTGKHLSYLRQANPYYKVLYVPFIYGEHSTTLNNIIDKCFKGVQSYNKENILTKNATENFCAYYTSLTNILEYLTYFTPEQQEIYNTATELYNYIQSDTYLNAKKEASKQRAIKTRAENKAKKELEQKKINEYKEKYSYYDLILLSQNHLLNWNDREFIKTKVLNVHSNYSTGIANALIWFNDDKVKTSKGVTVNKKDVVLLLKLWQAKKPLLGKKIENYTILAVTDDYIKVGCHIIPIENLRALLEVLNNENKTNVA